MNRNPGRSAGPVLSAMTEQLLWLQPPELNILVAAFKDDSRHEESGLLHALSEAERAQADSRTDSVERRHFIMRRCFQRVFVAKVIGWQQPLSQLELVHKLDAMPTCGNAVDLRLSFSSSGLAAVACASHGHCIGIDIEHARPISNAVALAERFFTRLEATAIANTQESDRDSLFLHLWTAKEAGLKAIGKGINSGLNRFTTVRKNGIYAIEKTDENESVQNWKLDYPGILPNCIVAMVHRPVDN